VAVNHERFIHHFAIRIVLNYRINMLQAELFVDLNVIIFRYYTSAIDEVGTSPSNAKVLVSPMRILTDEAVNPSFSVSGGC